MSGLDVALTPGWPTPAVIFGGGALTGIPVSIVDYSKIAVNVVVTGTSGTELLTVDIEHACDPNVAGGWTAISALQITTTGSPAILWAAHDMLSTGTLGQWIRLKASLATGTGTVVKAFQVRAVLRE